MVTGPGGQTTSGYVRSTAMRTRHQDHVREEVALLLVLSVLLSSLLMCEDVDGGG